MHVCLVRARATRNCEDVEGHARSKTLGSNGGAKQGQKTSPARRSKLDRKEVYKDQRRGK